MKSSEDVEKVLERFGSEWPSDGSIVDRVMHEIQSAPVVTISPNRRNILMKSLIGIAASVAVFALLWLGFASDRNSLYAQVMSAVHNARTFHAIQYAQPKGGAQPVKATESWFERSVGFREEGFGHIRLGNEEYLWSYAKDRKTATRSASNGIAKATESIFSQIDQLAQQLWDEFKRYPEGDQKFDGEPCRAYLLTKFDRYGNDASLKAGRRRMLLYIDQQSRLVRWVNQRREDNQYLTESFASFKYDDLIDQTLFQPDFGKDVRIVDADAAFDEFVSLKSAVHVEERFGLIYAIHRVERFENGGVLVVSSVRGTEETIGKYPLTKRRVRPGEFYVDGPASLPGSDRSDLLHLASASHQGIDVCWWAVIPGLMERPNCFEVAPGRLKLRVEVRPDRDFAKQFRDRDDWKKWYWDVDLNVPRPGTVPTVEEVAGRVYADQVALEAIPFNLLDIGRYDAGTAVFSEISKTTAAEYAKAIAEKVRSRIESDINFQIDSQFEPKVQTKTRPVMGNRVAIALSYSPLVNDATLERVAKRPSVTELYLRGTRITDAGLKNLSGLTKLDRLDLAETAVTDAGQQHLKGLAVLKDIDLTETKVTAEGAAMLKQAIPNVNIQWKATNNR